MLTNGKRMRSGAYCLLPERHRTDIGISACQEPTEQQMEEHKESLKAHRAYSKRVAALRKEYREVSRPY